MINKLKTFFTDILFCVRLIWNADKRSFSIILLFKGVEIIGAIVNLFVTRYLINQIIANISNAAGVGFVVLLIVAYSSYNLLYQFINDYSRKISGIITTECSTYLNISVMRKSVNLDYEYFDMPDKYNEFLRNQRSVASLHSVVDNVINLLGSIVMFISMLICCITFNAIWTLIAVVVLTPNYIYSVRYGKMRYELEKRQHREGMKRDYIYSLFFTKTDSQELRYGNSLQNVIEWHKALSWKLLNEKEKFNAKAKIVGIICSIPDILFIPLLCVNVVICIAKNILTLGDFSYVTGIYSNFSSSLIRLISGISGIYQYDERIKDFKEYYGYIDKDETELGDEIDCLNSIEFLHVNFKYPGCDEYVLNNLSLKLNSGEKTAIVGLNGSGKTTIFKLLCGFYKPESGHILINGKNIDGINVQSLRKHMAVLFQDYTVFSLSIRDNVTASDLESISNDDLQVKEALNMAGFHNIEYDKQQDTGLYIGKEFSQDGIILSGGQRQKLAIARALYRKADMIMLDEPSSSLDPESEFHLLKNLDHLYKNKILVMITHKLYTAKRADIIYCVEKGSVVEYGSHDELMDHHGLYYKMFTVQNNEE